MIGKAVPAYSHLDLIFLPPDTFVLQTCSQPERWVS